MAIAEYEEDVEVPPDSEEITAPQNGVGGDFEGGEQYPDINDDPIIEDTDTSDDGNFEIITIFADMISLADSFLFSLSTVVVPVTNIINVPSQTVAGTALALTGTVVPSNATYRAISWSVKNPGSTDATIDGNTLTTTTTGTVVVTAAVREVPPGTDIASLAAGDGHTLAIKTDGS